MKRLELSVAADADLFDILAYGTAVHGEMASDAYYAGLTQAFALLCKHPEAGQINEDSGLGLRRWRYRQHRIFYEVSAETVLGRDSFGPRQFWLCAFSILRRMLCGG